MNASNPDDSLSAITDLESVMADYIERSETGERLDPCDYLQRFPQFADDLRTFFQNHHWLAEPDAADISDSLIGKTIATYVIESEIARGGMGVVYRARQCGLDRPVALKLISSGVLASREERRRFRTEAEAAARLQHPGIVAIHETGDWQGYPFFSMTLVEGPTLQELIDDGAFPCAYAASLMASIAHAVQYSHRAGILHRDLKPDNILMSGDDRPMLTDFGLAKWRGEGTLLTRTGQILGTPNYMSPQQASGEAGIDPSSDIYSLGAILYAMLTGTPPHGVGSAAEILRSVLQDDPVPPRALRAEIPASLENICLKAIAREPHLRYQSAKAMADDLECWIQGNPVAADQSGLLGQVARELRRDQHQRHFADWSQSLLRIGGVIFFAHVMITLLALMQYPHWLSFWTPRVCMMTALGFIVYRAREGQLTPRTIAERPVFSIWLGYLASLGVMNLLVLMNLIPNESMFPATAVLSGFGFLSMSGHVWGGAAIIGFLFLIVALVLPFLGIFAPLAFGAAWLVGLVILANHYHHQP